MYNNFKYNNYFILSISILQKAYIRLQYIDSMNVLATKDRNAKAYPISSCAFSCPSL